MYTKIETPIYNLHIIKTDKYKKNVIEIDFKNKVVKKDIPKRRLLPDILTLSNSKYYGNRNIFIETENLYNLGLYCETRYSGNAYITSIGASFLNDKYVDGLFIKALNFVTDILFKPTIKNNGFDNTSFKKACINLKDSIDHLEEDPNSYTMEEVYKNIDPKGVLSYPTYGTKKEIDELTSKDVYKYYLNMLDNDKIDIFVIGNINIDVKPLIDEYFKNLKPRNVNIDHYIEHASFNNKYVEIKKTKPYNQSKLVIAYKVSGLTSFERQYVLPIYTYILGGGPDSKLFKNVREKNSLCYSISCNFKLVDNLMFIKSGIDKKNYKKAIKLIEDEVINMENGKFNNTDIEKAKITYLSVFDEVGDSIYSTLSDYVSREFINTDLTDTKKEEVVKVSKKDIMNVIPKIHKELIYLLEGSKVND